VGITVDVCRAQTAAVSNSGNGTVPAATKGLGYEATQVRGGDRGGFFAGGQTVRERWVLAGGPASPLGVGTTIVNCKVTHTGAIKQIKVAQSSGNRDLDSAAVATIAGISFSGVPSHFKGGELRLFFIHDLPSTPDHPTCKAISLAPAQK